LLREGEAEVLPADEERAVLAFAEGMADPGREVADDVFARVRDLVGDAGVVELGAWIGLQSLYSSFNRTFGIAAQGFVSERDRAALGRRAAKDA
jgi:alkylhydroperoxidase family enzyme